MIDDLFSEFLEKEKSLLTEITKDNPQTFYRQYWIKQGAHAGWWEEGTLAAGTRCFYYADSELGHAYLDVRVEDNCEIADIGIWPNNRHVRKVMKRLVDKVEQDYSREIIAYSGSMYRDNLLHKLGFRRKWESGSNWAQNTAANIGLFLAGIKYVLSPSRRRQA